MKPRGAVQGFQGVVTFLSFSAPKSPCGPPRGPMSPPFDIQVALPLEVPGLLLLEKFLSLGGL